MSSRDSLIEVYWPQLSAGGYKITSPRTPDRNCVAWAAGADDTWWEPDSQGQYYWPSGVERSLSVAAMVRLYGSLGYEKCDGPQFEPEYAKVAIFARQGEFQHAARQLPTGKWTSKLGDLQDIEHDLAALAGDKYGELAVVLKRPRRSK